MLGLAAPDSKKAVVKRIIIPSQGPPDWQWLLVKPELDWRSSNSAMKLTHAWEAAKDNLAQEIAPLLVAAAPPAPPLD